MTQPNWRILGSGVPVTATPVGLWVRAVDYVAGPRKLKVVTKIVAPDTGTWFLRKVTETTAAGRVIDLSGTLMLPHALPGALIGKVGGTAADNITPVGTPAVAPSTGAVVFAVGDFCIIELTAGQKGPLFLTMNDVATDFEQHSGQLTVDIFEAL